MLRLNDLCPLVLAANDNAHNNHNQAMRSTVISIYYIQLICAKICKITAVQSENNCGSLSVFAVIVADQDGTLCSLEWLIRIALGIAVVHVWILEFKYSKNCFSNTLNFGFRILNFKINF